MSDQRDHARLDGRRDGLIEGLGTASKFIHCGRGHIDAKGSLDYKRPTVMTHLPWFSCIAMQKTISGSGHSKSEKEVKVFPVDLLGLFIHKPHQSPDSDIWVGYFNTVRSSQRRQRGC